MYCANCGAQFDDDGKFCPVCGMKAEVEYVPETTVTYVTPAVPKNVYYEGSSGTAWTSFASGMCYLAWILFTILGGVLGAMTYNPGLLLIGLVIGFLIGFIAICMPMILLSISKNIATTTDNTVEILKRLDGRN